MKVMLRHINISMAYESIDVFASWTHDSERVYTKQSAFNAMWNDYEPNIKVTSFPNIDKEISVGSSVNHKIHIINHF